MTAPAIVSQRGERRRSQPRIDPTPAAFVRRDRTDAAGVAGPIRDPHPAGRTDLPRSGP